MSGDSLARRTVTNAGASAAYHLVSAAATLGITPYVVSALGLQRYGAWALMTVIIRYGLVADFGLMPALTRYVAEYHASEEHDKIREIVTLACVCYLGLGLIAVPLAAIAGPAILGFFQLPSALMPEACGAFAWFVAFFFAWQVASPLTALVNGVGGLRTTAAAGAVGQLLFAATTVVLLARGSGLFAPVIGSWLRLAVITAIVYRAGGRAVGPVFRNPLRADRSTLSRLFSTGGWIQVTSIAALVNGSTDQLVIARFIGIDAVGLYDIGSRFAGVLGAVFLHFNHAFLPAASNLAVRSAAKARSHSALVLGIRCVAAVSLIGGGYIAGCAPQLLHAWLGPAFGRPAIVVVVVVLVMTAVLTNIVGAPAVFLRATGSPRLETHALIVTTVVNIGLTLALARPFGIVGILAATLLATLAGSTWFTWRFHLTVAPLLTAPIVTSLVRLSVSTTVAVFVLVVFEAAFAGGRHGSRLVSLAACAAGGVVYLTAVLTSLRLVRFLTPRDLGVVRQVCPARFDRPLRTPMVRALFCDS